MICVDILNKDEVPFEELYLIMKEAFKERSEQGLDFTCLSWSFEEFVSKLRNDTILIAQNVDDRIIGFERLYFEDDFVHCGLIAVLPNFKRKGIGSLLIKTAEQLVLSRNCEYMLADTAVDAKSSVKWHLRNGFNIVGIDSGPNTNYYSYLFRKQLVFHPFWSNSLFCKIHYLFSVMKCRACYHADGKTTKLMNLYLRIRRVL